jgi:hypothetical protein
LLVTRSLEESSLPPKRPHTRIPIPFDELSAPAGRALKAAGYTTLDQLTRVRPQQIAALHGIGPKAIKILRRHLAARRLAFANEPSGPRPTPGS